MRPLKAPSTTYPTELTQASCAPSAGDARCLQSCVLHALCWPDRTWKVALGQATVLQRLLVEGISSPAQQHRHWVSIHVSGHPCQMFNTAANISGYSVGARPWARPTLAYPVGSLQVAPLLWVSPASCSAHPCWTSRHHIEQSKGSKD